MLFNNRRSYYMCILGFMENSHMCGEDMWSLHREDLGAQGA